MIMQIYKGPDNKWHRNFDECKVECARNCETRRIGGGRQCGNDPSPEIEDMCLVCWNFYIKAMAELPEDPRDRKNITERAKKLLANK